MPVSCAVTQLRVYAAGYNGSVSTRLAIWSSGGSAQAQTSTFTMAQGTLSVGGQTTYTKSITPVNLSSGTYWVGLYRSPSGGHIFGSNTSGVGYEKTNTSSFPSIASMSGYHTDSNSEPTVGAFYITAPANQSSQSVSRNSDTSQTVSWYRNADADQPYYTQYIERWDNVTNNWYTKATLTTDYTSNGSQSYNDTTTIANRRYRYRLRAWNNAGYSSYVYTDYIRTTPAAPTSVVGTRVGSTVSVDWTDNATAETAYTVERKTSTDGISWTSYSVLSSSEAADSENYIDSSPANYNQYRIKATCTDPTLSSAYAESNEVVILQPPNPPTSLYPDASQYDATSQWEFGWLHNSIDSTGQTKFSLQYRIVGAGSWTALYTEQVTSNEYVDIPASTFVNGNDYEWQVKTWGDATSGGTYGDGSSDWSASATFTATSQPTQTITTPTAVSDYTSSTLTMVATYTQAESENCTQYIAELNDPDDSYSNIETINATTSTASGGTLNITFETKLLNSKTYEVSLKVKSSEGLWSDTDYVEFDTDLLEPPTPTFTLTENLDNCSVLIDITNPSPGGGEVATDYNTVFRSLDGGETWEIAHDEVEPNTAITDYIPYIGKETYYYVQAVSAEPSTKNSSEDSITITKNGYFFLNAGEGYDNLIALRGDVTLINNFHRENVNKKYDGRDYPVNYKKINGKRNKLTFTCDLPRSDFETLESVIHELSNHMFRSWEGLRFHVSIDDCKTQTKTASTYTLTLLLERVDT